MQTKNIVSSIFCYISLFGTRQAFAVHDQNSISRNIVQGQIFDFTHFRVCIIITVVGDDELEVDRDGR